MSHAVGGAWPAVQRSISAVMPRQRRRWASTVALPESEYVPSTSGSSRPIVIDESVVIVWSAPSVQPLRRAARCPSAPGAQLLLQGVEGGVVGDDVDLAGRQPLE